MGILQDAAATMSITLNNGIKLPVIGIGTWLLKEKDEVQKIIKEALKCGYRRIDTSPDYENEHFIGEVIGDEQFLDSLGLKRSDFFVTTKVDPDHMGRENCRASVKRSLERLQTNYLDLVIIHWPGEKDSEEAQKNPDNPKLRKETWQELEALYKEGILNSIGVSNYNIKHLKELLEYAVVKPTVNQVEFHPLLYRQELLEFCNEHDIHLQAYSSLGSEKGQDELFDQKELKELAKKKNKSVAQILLRWARKQGVSIQPKTSKIDHLKTNLEIESFDLDDDEVSMISRINEDKHFLTDPEKIH